jgi:hypothetical protein
MFQSLLESAARCNWEHGGGREVIQQSDHFGTEADFTEA